MSWAHYLLQVNLYLVVFYGFYKLLLDRETYFILNRIYLLLAGGLSLSIPFLRFEWFVTHPVTQPIYTRVDQLNDLVTHTGIMQDTPESFNLGSTIVFIYIVGILFFSLKFIYKLYKVQTWLKKVESGNAYTFFNKKVIDQELPQVIVIDKHEEIHIRQLHTLDIIFFELVNIFTWFNPIIYLYKNTIKNIHEYLADEEAARFQGDKEAYALLLLSSALGVSPSNLMSTFFDKSLLKKRIFMLHKQRSRRAAILKYGLFLPIFALALILSSATIRHNEKLLAVAEEIPLNTPLAATGHAISNPLAGIVSDHKIKAPEAGNKKSDESIPAVNHINKVKETVYDQSKSIAGTTISESKKEEITETKEEDPDKVYDFVSIYVQPSFPGGMDKFYSYLKKTIKYPQIAEKNNVEGKVYLSFTVEKDGALTDIKVDRKLGSGTDEEAIRVLAESPKWTPGINNGAPVRVKYNIQIGFNLARNNEPKVLKEPQTALNAPSKARVSMAESSQGFNTK